MMDVPYLSFRLSWACRREQGEESLKSWKCKTSLFCLVKYWILIVLWILRFTQDNKIALTIYHSEPFDFAQESLCEESILRFGDQEIWWQWDGGRKTEDGILRFTQDGTIHPSICHSESFDFAQDDKNRTSYIKSSQRLLTSGSFVNQLFFKLFSGKNLGRQ